MLIKALKESSNKTILLEDRLSSDLLGFNLASAILKIDSLNCKYIAIVETEIDGWSSTFSTEGLTFNKLQIWKDQFESDGDQDELKLIYDRLNTPGPKLVVLYSLTPLLFRHSPTAVARFICALASLSDVRRLIACCHSDCHALDEKSSVELSTLLSQVSDVVISFLGSASNSKIEEKKLSNCCVTTLSQKGSGKTSIQRVSISVDESFRIEESNQSKKSKPAESASTSDPDKFMQTTFRLGLKISEKEAKSQVVLPFWKTEASSASASIEYTPDEADDWDEEDPDDDLDF